MLGEIGLLALSRFLLFMFYPKKIATTNTIMDPARLEPMVLTLVEYDDV